MKNFNEFVNEAVNYKDRSGKPFKIKGINFILNKVAGFMVLHYMMLLKPQMQVKDLR